MAHKGASKEYEQLATKRFQYLDRAYTAAELTIPFLLPRNESQDQDLPTPYQGLGARAVNNLSAKLLLTLFPPNQPFHKYQVDDFTLEELENDQNAEITKGEVEKGLASAERAVVNEVEAKAMRVPLYEALRHLITTGNVLLFLNPKNGFIKVFHLDQFVVRRDPSGQVLKIIVKEVMSRELFEDMFGPVPDSVGKTGPESKDSTVDVFTVIKREDKKWETYQEVKNKRIGNTEASYPIERSPWMALRFSRIDGEDYGRGFVEEYLGDLRALEGLQKAILEGSAAAARVYFLLNPQSTLTPNKLAAADNLDILAGKEGDVSVVQLQKFNDFAVAKQTIDALEQRLASAFLLNQSVQRDAERVTAEEIRFMASELETALGGIYSILSNELQLPLVKVITNRLEKEGKLPQFPDDIVKPVIITGFEALGRGNDANKMMLWIRQAAEAIGPENVIPFINPSEFLARTGVGFGIDTKDLVRGAEEVAQEKQAQQMAAAGQDLAGKLGPTAIKEMNNQPSEG